MSAPGNLATRSGGHQLQLSTHPLLCTQPSTQPSGQMAPTEHAVPGESGRGGSLPGPPTTVQPPFSLSSVLSCPAWTPAWTSLGDTSQMLWQKQGMWVRDYMHHRCQLSQGGCVNMGRSSSGFGFPKAKSEAGAVCPTLGASHIQAPQRRQCSNTSHELVCQPSYHSTTRDWGEKQEKY